MQDIDQPIDYDEIIRRAEAMRSQALAEMARAVIAWARRRPVAKPLPG